MKIKNLLLFCGLCSGSTCYCGDTTLYNKRVEKIKTLAIWLNKRPNFRSNSFVDTSLKSLKTYDTAINLFFDKTFMNSQYNLKAAIYTFDYMLPSFPIDSFILKTPRISSDTLIDVGGLYFLFQQYFYFLSAYVWRRIWRFLFRI